MNRNRLILISGFLIAIGGCAQPSETHANEAAPKVVHARTVKVEETHGAAKFVATGAVKSSLNASLSSKVTGRVLSVLVHEGDFVKKGQLLVMIDPRELQAATQVAAANYHAAVIGVSSAQKSVEIEDRTSRARIGQAKAQIEVAKSALATAKARYDLVKAGPRTQEVAQSHIAVTQAESTLKLAKTELDRIGRLVKEGALAKQQLDQAQNQYDLAKGQLDAAIQSQSIAMEGSRQQEIRGAQDAVTEAEASLMQSRSGLAQAQATAMQIELKRKEVEVSQAQVQQSLAALQSAQVSESYCQVLAPFDGRITLRSVDPGAMASPGVPLLMIEGGEFQLEATVPERVIAFIAEGKSTPIAIDALTPNPLPGRVRQILPQGDALSHRFTVKFLLPDSKGLKSGMFGRAAITTGASNSIQIPASATWEREGLHYVFAVNSEGIARLRLITLGESLGDQVEVLSGLSKGDRIVTINRDAVSDGCKIEGN